MNCFEKRVSQRTVFEKGYLGKLFLKNGYKKKRYLDQGTVFEKKVLPLKKVPQDSFLKREYLGELF